MKVKSKEIDALEYTIRKKNDILDVLQARHLEIIKLKGQDIDPNSYGKFIWEPFDSSAVLQVSNLIPASSKEDYQLWLVKGDTSISEGVFRISRPDSENFFKIDNLQAKNLSNLDSIMLTLEKKGGAVKPQGVIYLLGNP